jgi:non-ribosomal peptide synthase protein (TIGR01720 family)
MWLDRFPVTANGKVDLARLPEPGAGPRTGRAPATDAERTLAAIWREILNCPTVHLDDNFFQLGGDSILSLKVVSRARRAGLKITPKQLHLHPTLAEAARVAVPIPDAAAAPRATASGLAPTTSSTGIPRLADASAVSIPLPSTTSTAASAATARAQGAQPALLTPIQLRFLERQPRDPHHYNQAVLLELARPLDLPQLDAALAALTRHHDALRLRFRREAQRWSAWYAEPADSDSAVTRVDLREAADPASAIDRACDELQRSFDLERGPLLRAAYLDLGVERAPRLLLFAHHLVVDGVSWRILLEDLAARVTHPGVPLPPPTTSFARWAEHLHHHAASAALAGERAHWQRAIAPHADDRLEEPRRGSNTVGDAAVVSAELEPAATTALLSRAPRAHATRVNDLLLAALATSLCRRWRRSSLLVTMEGHGREELVDERGESMRGTRAAIEPGSALHTFEALDLSRTVGWFSTLYPVRLAPVPGDAAATIRAVQAQLRQAPAGGIGYGLLRHLAPEPLRAPPDEPRVTFNYLGQFDQSFAGQDLFRVARETSGRRRNPHTPRDGWFVLNALVHDGALCVDWEYSRALHDRGEAQHLLADFLAELRAIIAHCESVLGGAA